MNRLRGLILTLAAALFLLMSAGSGWALEIVAAEGRPWDTGAIGVSGPKKNARVYHKNPNMRVVSPGDDAFAGDRQAKTLEDWFAVIEAFLHP